jgi:hypothetical protein
MGQFQFGGGGGGFGNRGNLGGGNLTPKRIVRGGASRKRRKGRVDKRLKSDPLKELGATPNTPAIDPMMLIRKRSSRGRR